MSRKTVMNLLIIVIIALILIFTMSIVDFNLVLHGNLPKFCFNTVKHDDGGTMEYTGIGYKIIAYNATGGRHDIKIGSMFLRYEPNIDISKIESKPDNKITDYNFIGNVIKITNESNNTVLLVEANDKTTLFMATQQGFIKKTNMKEFESLRKNGKIAIKLEEGDQLVSVQATTGKDELLIASNNGKCVRFSENDVRTMGRNSRGVKGMKIDKGEKIIGMIVLNPEKDILTVTEFGYAKRTKREDYRLQSRRGKGTKAGRFNDKTGEIIAIKPIDEKEDIIAITSSGIVIRTHADQINEVGRTALGVKLMNTAGCKIVGVSIVERQEDEDLENEEDINTSNDENLEEE